jgi:hypothetical protein
MPTQKLINALGFAGLIPFVVPAAMVANNVNYADFAIAIVEIYAFGIICFLVGSWWGMSLGTNNRVVVLISNVYFIGALLLLSLVPSWWSLTAAILLIGIFVLEQKRSFFPSLPKYYRRMRAFLTFISGSSMLIVHFAR